MSVASCKHGVGAFQPCRECDDETDKAAIIAERDRLRAEVANRNQRALDGDKAKAAFDNVFDENERLRAELELHKGALIAEQEHVETLEAELSASREDAERYRHLLREAYVFGRTTPDVHNLPNEPVSLWLHSTVPLDVEGINRIVDAARKGEGE